MTTTPHRGAPRERAWLVPAASSHRLGLALVGALLFIAFSLAYPNFFAAQNVEAIGLNVSSIALAAVGSMLLVLSGKVDLSIGSQFALVSVVTAMVVQSTQSAVAGVIAAVVAGALLGLVNGLLVKYLSINPLIVTLGMLAIYRGVAYALSGGLPIFGFPPEFTRIGSTRFLGVPTPIVISVLVFVAGAVFLLRTVPGLRLYAIGGDEEAARRAGIRTDRALLGVFTANGAVIGLVALLSVARLSSGSPQVGVQFELDVLTAVILGGFAFAGGIGHPLGVAAGVLTIGILNAGLIFAGLEDFYQQIAKGALLVLALAADQVLARYRMARQARGAPVARESIAGHVDTAALRESREIGDELLAARGITVRFGNVEALKDAGLSVRAGEVVCLLGDNGAGKSTLIKTVSGVIRPDAGELLVGGERVTVSDPQHARAAGVETVYQDLALCPNLGVAHNLVLGDEPRRRWCGVPGWRDDRAAARLASSRLGRLNVPIHDVNRPVHSFSGGQRQSVAIARVLRDDLRVVILDEPTAALGVAQTAQVLRLIADIARSGHGVVFITHDVEQVFSVADRVVVMRLGRVVHDGPVADLAPLQLVELMAGVVPQEGVAT
jgi:ribose/xylose/arabinose/galactoside ABC-type transport system permease subunit/ABC-type branched-subunit amino acid transport system ATPase component